jgi:hypothetical protein
LHEFRNKSKVKIKKYYQFLVYKCSAQRELILTMLLVYCDFVIYSLHKFKKKKIATMQYAIELLVWLVPVFSFPLK